MNEEKHPGPWLGLLRTVLSQAPTPCLVPPQLVALYGDLLVAPRHLQVAEVGDALHVGMEGKEATQEVVPSQVEVGVLYQLAWLCQSVEQEKQQVECLCLGPHDSEVTALDATTSLRSLSLHSETFAQTFT